MFPGLGIFRGYVHAGERISPDFHLLRLHEDDKRNQGERSRLSINQTEPRSRQGGPEIRNNRADRLPVLGPDHSGQVGGPVG
jgi:hypothetical protein